MNKEFESYNLENNRTLEEMSRSSSIYTFQTEFEHGKPVYPWAPTTHIQKHNSGIPVNFIDANSELKNITRKLSNNPMEQYQPGQGFQEPENHQDGFFHQDSSRLTNNPQELRGTGWNRWEPLFFNPQKNSIEPFKRIGTNTVLETLDESLQCSVTNNNNNFNNDASDYFEKGSTPQKNIVRDPSSNVQYQLNQNPNEILQQNETVLSN